MNESEQQVADALDALHVIWEYEPTMFVLRTDDEGRPLEGFRPDFYLEKYNLYIEVTMGKNSNLTLKNHKVRLVQELYPGVRVELISRRHFADLSARLSAILSDAA